MKLIKNIQPLTNVTYIYSYFPENFMLFDIETTGFSPSNAFIYLIGTAFRIGNELHVHQFLAENRHEEASILQEFLYSLAKFDGLLSFNGAQFDIPFIKKRCIKHGITENLNAINHKDLYKSASKLKNILKLSTCRQKSIEEFLGIYREDIYNGGELIPIYYQYEKNASSEYEKILLLHNFEDVVGMTDLLQILTYEDVFLTSAKVTKAQVQSYLPYGSDTEATELFLTLQNTNSFPKSVLYHTEEYSILMENSSIQLRIPVTNNQLKLYHTNYKDYYYLPEEDTAIHKSVSAYVDASHRKKATKATCYTRFQITKDFLSDTDTLNTYATQLLHQCI